MLLAILLPFTAFLLGSIPSGLLWAKFFGLADPRTIGSGNIGASNVTRLGGKKIGALTLISDAVKGSLPVLFALYYFPESSYLAAITGLCTVVGHCYSIYLNFNGGKGVATALGVFLTLTPFATFFAILTWLLVFYVERITSIAAMSACLIIPLILITQNSETSTVVVSIVIAALIIRRHEQNLKDLIIDKERTF